MGRQGRKYMQDTCVKRTCCNGESVLSCPNQASTTSADSSLPNATCTWSGQRTLRPHLRFPLVWRRSEENEWWKYQPKRCRAHLPEKKPSVSVVQNRAKNRTPKLTFLIFHAHLLREQVCERLPNGRPHAAKQGSMLCSPAVAAALLQALGHSEASLLCARGGRQGLMAVLPPSLQLCYVHLVFSTTPLRHSLCTSDLNGRLRHRGIAHPRA